MLKEKDADIGELQKSVRVARQPLVDIQSVARFQWGMQLRGVDGIHHHAVYRGISRPAGPIRYFRKIIGTESSSGGS